LVPTGRATMATAANIAKFEGQRHQLEAKAHAELASAKGRAVKFENFKLELKAKAGSEGKLFGSIGTADIAEAAVKAGQPITRSEVRMPNGPIRSTGEHAVQLHLHTDVNVALLVTIVPEE
jgi:large subunit ribosomal protein L9